MLLIICGGRDVANAIFGNEETRALIVKIIITMTITIKPNDFLKMYDLMQWDNKYHLHSSNDILHIEIVDMTKNEGVNTKLKKKDDGVERWAGNYF